MNERKLKLAIDNVKYTRKPIDKEVGGINNRLASTNNQHEIDIPTLARVTGVEGYSWCQALLDGDSRQGKSYVSQDVLVLDFDNDDPHSERYTSKEVIERLTAIGLPPTYVYKSFRWDTILEKFRVVYVLPETLCNKALGRALIQSMRWICEQLGYVTDPHTVDPTRLFFGGKGLLYEAYSNVFNVYNMVAALYDIFNGRLLNIDPIDPNALTFNARKETLIRDFCFRTQIELSNGLPCIDIASYHTPTQVDSVYNGWIFRLGYKGKPVKRSMKSMGTEVKHDFEKLQVMPTFSNECRLYNEFVSGELCKSRGGHDGQGIMFGIASNLSHIKIGYATGLDIYATTINNQSWHNQEKKLAIIQQPQICQKQYQPVNCCNFCPYYATCGNCTNMSRVLTGDYRLVYNVDQKIDYNFSEDEYMTDKDTEIMSNIIQNHKILINGGMGVGKTTFFLSESSKYRSWTRAKKYVTVEIIPTRSQLQYLRKKYPSDTVKVIYDTMTYTYSKGDEIILTTPDSMPKVMAGLGYGLYAQGTPHDFVLLVDESHQIKTDMLWRHSFANINDFKGFSKKLIYMTATPESLCRDRFDIMINLHKETPKLKGKIIRCNSSTETIIEKITEYIKKDCMVFVQNNNKRINKYVAETLRQREKLTSIPVTYTVNTETQEMVIVDVVEDDPQLKLWQTMKKEKRLVKTSKQEDVTVTMDIVDYASADEQGDVYEAIIAGSMPSQVKAFLATNMINSGVDVNNPDDVPLVVIQVVGNGDTISGITQFQGRPRNRKMIKEMVILNTISPNYVTTSDGEQIEEEIDYISLDKWLAMKEKNAEKILATIDPTDTEIEYCTDITGSTGIKYDDNAKELYIDYDYVHSLALRSYTMRLLKHPYMLAYELSQSTAINCDWTYDPEEKIMKKESKTYRKLTKAEKAKEKEDFHEALDELRNFKIDIRKKVYASNHNNIRQLYGKIQDIATIFQEKQPPNYKTIYRKCIQMTEHNVCEAHEMAINYYYLLEGNPDTENPEYKTLERTYKLWVAAQVNRQINYQRKDTKTKTQKTKDFYVELKNKNKIWVSKISYIRASFEHLETSRGKIKKSLRKAVFEEMLTQGLYKLCNPEKIKAPKTLKSQIEIDNYIRKEIEDDKIKVYEQFEDDLKHIYTVTPEWKLSSVITNVSIDYPNRYFGYTYQNTKVKTSVSNTSTSTSNEENKTETSVPNTSNEENKSTSKEPKKKLSIEKMLSSKNPDDWYVNLEGDEW